MRKASITRNGSGDANADAALAKMGYASELPGNFEYAEYSRNVRMGLSYLGFLLGLLIYSRSFAIMAVPFGLSTTLYITLTDGQSVTILWGWVLVSLVLYGIAGLFWLPVVWIQTRMRDLAQVAVAAQTPLPDAYHRLFRVWFAFGFPGFGAVVAIYWLMIAKPDL